MKLGRMQTTSSSIFPTYVLMLLWNKYLLLKMHFFSIIRCMLVVEDVERRAPTWNLTLFTSEDHMSSSTRKSCQVSANLWGPLWPYLTEKTPDGRKREFYGTMGSLHSSNLGPTGEHWDRAPLRGVLANVDSRFEKIPSVCFQLRWFLGAWQLSSNGGWGRMETREPSRLTSANYWVFGSLS